jgi:hypothetical protein
MQFVVVKSGLEIRVLICKYLYSARAIQTLPKPLDSPDFFKIFCPARFSLTFNSKRNLAVLH